MLADITLSFGTFGLILVVFLCLWLANFAFGVGVVFTHLLSLCFLLYKPWHQAPCVCSCFSSLACIKLIFTIGPYIGILVQLAN